MPFGVITAPAMFQGKAEQLFGNLDCRMMYIHTVVVGFTQMKDHMGDLQRVPHKFHKSDQKVKWKKCPFHYPQDSASGTYCRFVRFQAHPTETENHLTGRATPLQDETEIFYMF